MGVSYKAISWNRQKKQYDWVLFFGMILYLAVFIGSNLLFFPEITLETLIIRSTGTLAIIMLHFILMIGPLARISKKFLPFLYNRRHFGVAMFLMAAIHGAFSLIQFHGLGNENMLVSLFTANTHYGDIMRFPFQPLGFFALLILFVMAATSHDFWLKQLGPRFWKSMHMMVYLAYGLLVMHVMLGVMQLEQSVFWIGGLGAGMLSVIGLHLYAGFKGGQITEYPTNRIDDFYKVGHVDEIKNDRAKMVIIEGENIAIFKYDGKLSAVNNACKHQNGPLGEGKVIDGCITCPWHGYQYQPEDGCSPPPFKEQVSTYQLKLIDQIIYVDPKPKAEGSFVEPIIIAEA